MSVGRKGWLLGGTEFVRQLLRWPEPSPVCKAPTAKADRRRRAAHRTNRAWLRRVGFHMRLGESPAPRLGSLPPLKRRGFLDFLDGVEQRLKVPMAKHVHRVAHRRRERRRDGSSEDQRITKLIHKRLRRELVSPF